MNYEKEIGNLNKDATRLLEKYEEKIKEIKRLNNIINELEKCIKNKYYEAIDYQTKIRQSDLMQGDYPVSYYLEEQNEQLCNYFLNRLKDLQELKGEEYMKDKEYEYMQEYLIQKSIEGEDNE